jgi:hypothetical protein
LIRILFLAADVEEVKLDLVGEYKGINLALLKSKYRDQFDIRFIPSARLEELQEYLLLYEPNVVHFAGSSTQEAVRIQDANGKTRRLSESAFSNMVGTANSRRNIRCVLINTGYSKSMAEALSRHIDCVIGQETLITDNEAIKFASSFYLTLGSGYNINGAFNNACIALESADDTSEIIMSTSRPAPILKYAPGIDPANVFLVRNHRNGE